MTRPVDVLFVWHFHQPYYGSPGGDEFFMPWVRLHAVKSYYDMARLLEEYPSIRATFNFSGSLLRQLVEYVDDDKRDRWWRWSSTGPGELELTARREMIRNFFSISHERCIEPLARYRQLLEARRHDGIATCANTWSDQQLLDLQVLFNLAWCGFAARDDFPLIGELLEKGRDFTADDRDRLLDTHTEIMGRVLPLYRKLADRDQIEISVTPMYHPIIPLLIDTDTAARPSPDRPRPERYCAPEDARFHISSALDLAESVFGRRPRGMWPSEGSVSPEAIELFDDAGVSWIATDEEILAQSRGDDYRRTPDLFGPWTLGDDGPRIFFRDHGLSDQIGFVYADNPADEAADDFVDHLTIIADDPGDEPGAISVILDGENPWEHYEDDGRLFLQALYEKLEAQDLLQTTVPCDVKACEPRRLQQLHSGSWIMANYQIWIGHEETNTGWNWLRRAAKEIDEVQQTTPDHPGLESAREHLRIAQGSDWFWWYGDDFSTEQDDQFDALFRALVCGVWTSLGEPCPAELNEPIHHRKRRALEDDDSHIEPPRRYITPTVDGKTGDFFDWVGAGQITVSGAHGSMYENFRPLKAILFGFSPDTFFLRLEPGTDFSDRCHFEVHIHGNEHHLTIEAGPTATQQALDEVSVAFDDAAELALPLHGLELSPGDALNLSVSVHRDGLQVQRFPLHDTFSLTVPDRDPGRKNWIV